MALTTAKLKFEQKAKIKFIGDKFVSCLNDTAEYLDTSKKELVTILNELHLSYWRDVITRHYYESNNWLWKIIIATNRSLFLDLLPIEKEDLALDLGAGWGQITIPLSQRCDVVAVEGNVNKLEIIKSIADQEKRNNIIYILSNILDLPFDNEQFNIIIMNGVLEWVGVSRKDGDPIDLQKKALSIVYELLVHGGYFYLGIENKLGLKYLLGEKDDHLGLKDFVYLPTKLLRQKYKEMRNEELRVFIYEKTEYEELLKEAGFKDIKFYVALPDYKIPQAFIELSDPKVLEHFFASMIIPDEHRGDGVLSENNEKLKIIYNQLAKYQFLGKLMPSFSIICKK